MKTTTQQKRAQFMTRRHSVNELFNHLLKMGFPPKNVVYTGYGIFFTLYCDESDRKELNEFVGKF